MKYQQQICSLMFILYLTTIQGTKSLRNIYSFSYKYKIYCWKGFLLSIYIVTNAN